MQKKSKELFKSRAILFLKEQGKNTVSKSMKQ